VLMRFDPFRELDRLTQQTWGQQRSVLPMDAFRRGDEFVVSFDLPGVDPDSIELTVEKNVLTVKAERPWARTEGDEVLISERHHGSFTRQLFLSESLDTDHIRATCEQGVLTVSIPVAEKAKPRRVEIGGGDDQPAAVEATSTTTAAA